MAFQAKSGQELGTYAQAVAEYHAKGRDDGKLERPRILRPDSGRGRKPDNPHADLAAKRQEQIRPITDNHSARIETRPSGKLEEAVTCAVNQKAFLRTFLCHGEVEAGNSPVESAQRGMVVGR